MPTVYNKRFAGSPSGIPKTAVYVGRPSKWGNPFELGARIPRHIRLQVLPSSARRLFDRPSAIAAFRWWVWQPEQEALRAAARAELRGRDLVCWCVPLDCHAWIWMEIANAD
jgi:hypothetical protein